MITPDKLNHIFEQLLAEIKKRLQDNELVHLDLPNAGRLHIDRQLPFLVVYRNRSESGGETARKLLTGQAAYVQIAATVDSEDFLKRLVQLLAEMESARYGAFMVLEIWARDVAAISELQELPHPGFTIYAPEHDVPANTLQTLEHALQSITLRGQKAKVEITYRDNPAPQGLEPLLEVEPMEPGQGGYLLFGLEIDAVYRDADSSTVFSYALKKIHDALAVALKKTFFAFAHDFTSFKPEHFHVLGRRRMTDVVKQVDAMLADVSDDFDLLLHVTPVNSHDAWEAFQQSGYDCIPEFLYRPRKADPALLKRKLYQAPIEEIEDPALDEFFSSKRDELDLQISLLADRGASRFLYSSILLYGMVEDSLMQQARQILEHPQSAEQADADEFLNAEELARYAREEVEYYQGIDPAMSCKVEVRDDITGILVSHGNFLISSDAVASRQRLRATLSHEIGTHALTHFNGRQQPFQQLYAGMAGYEELQEGLAVLAEYLVGGLTLGRLRMLAARVLAADSVTRGADFMETYRLVHDDCSFEPHMAFMITLRVHRGGGYTKDMVYLRGLLQLLEYLGESGNIEILFTGKVSLAFLPLIEELMWREVIKPGALMPRYMQLPESRERLARLCEAPGLRTVLGSMQA